MSILEQITTIQIEARRLLDARDEAVARADKAEKENGELLDENFRLQQQVETFEKQRQIRELAAERRRSA